MRDLAFTVLGVAVGVFALAVCNKYEDRINPIGGCIDMMMDQP